MRKVKSWSHIRKASRMKMTDLWPKLKPGGISFIELWEESASRQKNERKRERERWTIKGKGIKRTLDEHTRQETRGGNGK